LRNPANKQRKKHNADENITSMAEVRINPKRVNMQAVFYPDTLGLGGKYEELGGG